MKTIKIFLYVQLFFWLPMLATNVFSQEQFMLKGQISGKAPEKIILSYVNKLGKSCQDTVKVEQGKFSIKGEISGPTFSYLIGKVTSLSMDDPNRTVIFLEPGIMEVELSADDFPDAKVKGSVSHSGFYSLNMTKRPLVVERGLLRETLDSINKEINLQGKSGELQGSLKKAGARWSAIHKSLKEIELDFVKANRKSIVSAFLLPALLEAKMMSLDSVEVINSGFPATVRNSSIGRRLETTIKSKRAVVVGNQAPFLNGTDIDGKIVNSGNYIGEKYLLLDFWASWCVPCHEQAPYLNKLFDKYRNLGLEMISVSADQDRSAWRKSIGKDKIDRWTNMLMSDNQDPMSKVNDRFAISGYPVILLIDKQGTIVYRADGYGGAEEMKKLEELIGSHMAR